MSSRTKKYMFQYSGLVLLRLRVPISNAENNRPIGLRVKKILPCYKCYINKSIMQEPYYGSMSYARENKSNYFNLSGNFVTCRPKHQTSLVALYITKPRQTSLFSFYLG